LATPQRIERKENFELGVVLPSPRLSECSAFADQQQRAVGAKAMLPHWFTNGDYIAHSEWLPEREDRGSGTDLELFRRMTAAVQRC
jgi:hypothetical protein